MVRRLQNGTLSWTQRRMGIVTVSPDNSAAYSAALETENLQINAEVQNSAAENLYLADVEKQQVSVDASLPVDHIPVQPLYIRVSDPVMDRAGVVAVGVSTTTPWPEPLPVLVPKTVWKSGASAPTIEPIQVKPQP